MTIRLAAQFADPRLRRFNLLTVDYIARGRTEGSVPDVYGVREHALDLANFLVSESLVSRTCMRYS